ncbi:hypothetical protein GQ53DRAFT_810808 [Thozetella sp. PMI_491]|nr:hypothetical protein GQ53DRAFT_810808 [Thozetella sp. PMI_491]
MVLSVAGRMAAFVILSLVLFGSPASSLISSHPEADCSEVRLASPACPPVANDPLPGFQALYGSQERLIDIWKRDCLPNGTNYCFGDGVSYCSSCGTCCTQGKYCCSSSQTCCGTGCCDSGETCSEGKCISSQVSSSSSILGGSVATTTTIIFQTVTRVATQVATVVFAEVDTSTVVSTVEVTVTDAATQTDLVWVTVTAEAAGSKRTPTLLEQERFQERGDTHEEPESPLPIVLQTLKAAWGVLAGRGLGTKLNHLVDDLAPIRRADPPATLTTTVLVTQTTAVDSIVSTTVTTAVTSFVQTTIFETVTKALNAKFTTTVTSTFTLTSHPRTTQIVTNTANVVFTQTSDLAPITSTASSTPAPSASGSALSTPAIAGIAAGSAAFVIILAGLVAFIWFRRHKTKVEGAWQGDATHSYLNYDPELPPPGQTLMMKPTLPRVSFTPNPAHHSVQFQPPAAAAAATAHSALPSNELAATEAAAAARHQRSSSGFTTLVGGIGTPSPGPSGSKKGGNGRASMATVGSQTQTLCGSRQAQELASVTIQPAEADSNEATRWFEVDAMNGVPVGEPEEHHGYGVGRAQVHGRQEQQQNHHRQTRQESHTWAAHTYNSQELDGNPYVMPEELEAAGPGMGPGTHSFIERNYEPLCRGCI